MADQPAVPDMETEVDRAPAQNALAYAAISGPRGKLVGGGEVYFSNNVKSAVKARAAGKVPQTFLTSEVNRAQQSIGYNAIAAALTHEVIPVAHVVKRYVNAGKLGTVLGLLLAQHTEAFAAALRELDSLDGAVSALLTEPETPEPDMEQEQEEDPGE